MNAGKKAAIRMAALCTATLMAVMPASAADASAGIAKARAGKCFDCHGERGAADSSGYPNLAGQHPAYLLKQLADFRSGARKSPFMNIVAANLDERDGADIAAYFASLARAPAVAAPDSQVAAARRLYREGDPARALPACASCHGQEGAGAADGSVPALAGQQMFYLREQLLNWHLGLRNNSPGRSMNSAADPLTASEIDALARYMAGM